MFASLRCSADRASPSARHKDNRNVVRVAGRLTGDRLLESIFRHRRVERGEVRSRTSCLILVFIRPMAAKHQLKISHETIRDYRRIPLLAFLSRKATSKAGNCPPLR